MQKQILTIDFETYYDKEYSLSKMTNEEYVRDPRFEIIGVAKKLNKDPSLWFSGTHEEIASFLDDGVAWEKTYCCAHNAAFDGSILSWILNRKPALWLDTLSMARPKHLKTTGVSLAVLAEFYELGAKGFEVQNALGKQRKDFSKQELHTYGEYCKNDNELAYKLLKIFSKETSQLELRIIDSVIRMFTEPKLVLNKKNLEVYLEEILTNKRALLDKVGGEETLSKLMSNPQFAELLKSHGVTPPTKISTRTKKETFAFAKSDKGLKDLLEHPNEEVQALVACRLGIKSTIEETRARSLIGIASRGAMPILLNYWGAGTGRFSGGDGINPQNLKRGGKIRDAIEAPEGSVIVTSDLSQIEARILAYVSGQQDLLEAFKEGRDVYSEFASEAYGTTITKANKEERFVGKTCMLGLGFYTGPAKLKETLRIGQGGVSVVVSLEEAERIVRLYRQKNHKIVSFWRACDYALRGMLKGGNSSVGNTDISYNGTSIELPNGSKLHYPELQDYTDPDTGEQYFRYLNRKRWTKIYSGLLCENIVQALARGVIVEYMDTIASTFGVVLQVHDEVVSIVPEVLAEDAKKKISAIMSAPPPWLPNLPVACEVGSGRSYGQSK